MAAIIVTGALSIAAARYPMTSALQVVRYVEILGVLILIVVTECTTERQIGAMVFSLLVGGLVASLIGIGQFVYFAETTGLLHRVSGLHGGAYGGVVGSTFCLALGVLLHNPSRGKKIFAFIVLSCAMSALILSQTRAWIGGTICGVAAALVLGRRLRVRWLIVLACTGALAAFVVTQTDFLGFSTSGFLRGAVTRAFRYEAPSNRMSVGDMALYERLIVWSRGASLAVQNPLFGIGAGNLRFDNYLTAHLSAPTKDAGFVDNQYLNFFAEAGIVAGAAWIFFLAVAFRVGLESFRGSHGTRVHGEAYGLFQSLFVFAVGTVFWVLTAHHDAFSMMILEIALMYNIARLVRRSETAPAPVMQ